MQQLESRDYQKKDFIEIKKSLAKNNSLLYQLSTGGGKSVIASLLVSDFYDAGKRVLVLAHRRRLIDQLQGHFENRGLNVGKLIGKIENDLHAPVVVASVHTATRENRLNTLLENDFDYIIIDEAHRTASTSYDNIINGVRLKNPKAKLLGITATPTRRDKKNLGAYYDALHCSVADVKTLVSKGFLAESVTYSTPVRNLDDVEKNSNDYKITALSTYMKSQERVDYAVESYKLHGENKQMLVFCVDKSHAKSIMDAYIKAGFVSIAYIDGDTPENLRQSILDSYEANELQIIVSIEVLIEGVDLPNTNVIQNNRPTKSLVLKMQMEGRGMRRKSDNSKLIILDNAGCSREFGLVDSPKTWSLDPQHDPCSPSAENKIVAKRKDGSYTEDLDEAEHLELEEMSHEDYVEKMLNNLDSAGKYNSQLEKDVMAKSISIIRSILVEVGLDKFYGIKDDGYSDASCNEFTLIEPNKPQIYQRTELDLKIKFHDGKIRVGTRTYGNPDYLQNNQEKEWLECLENQAKFIKFFMDKKNTLKYFTEFALNIARLAKKIDMRKLRELAESAKQDILLNKIDEKISEGGVILVSERPTLERLDNIYPSVGWDFGHRRIKSIKFHGTYLKMSNQISLLSEDGSEIYSSKSAKREKILEILERLQIEI